VQTKRDDIEVEYCPSCRGMWLSRQELEELEDEVFDLGDDEKGTLIFSATTTNRKCPQCSKPMKRFKYRLYDLEVDFCEDGHGFWLDADEDKRILELMKQEEADLERKVFAEDRFAVGLQYMRSGSFLDIMRSWQAGLQDVDFGLAIANLMRRLRPPRE
jgi:Zn-finger nucleic acid-binding protein